MAERASAQDATDGGMFRQPITHGRATRLDKTAKLRAEPPGTA